MARITKEEREARIARIDESILQLFLEGGIDNISYRTVAEKSGFRISSVQNYYPSAELLPHAITGKVLPYIMKLIDWSSEESFVDSWVTAVREDVGMQNILVLMFARAMQNNKQSRVGFRNLMNAIGTHFGEDRIEPVMVEVFGRSAFALMGQQRGGFDAEKEARNIMNVIIEDKLNMQEIVALHNQFADYVDQPKVDSFESKNVAWAAVLNMTNEITATESQ